MHGGQPNCPKIRIQVPENLNSGVELLSSSVPTTPNFQTEIFPTTQSRKISEF